MTVLLVAGALCAACSEKRPPEGTVGHVEGNFGGVVSDEPRSALVGRDILSSGGNAIDAVVAMYFAMSVTYPGAASLGGEGVCVVKQSDREATVEAIEFPPLLIHRDGVTVAIPGAVRAMFAMHARYGRLPWSRLVQPAEELARFGSYVSRAFARQLAQVPAADFRQQAARDVFVDRGKVLGEGSVVHQVQLATVLSAIRVRGAGDFYTADLAKRIADGLSSLYRVPVTVADVRRYAPRWVSTARLNIRTNVLHMPEGAKAEAAIRLWKRVLDGDATAAAGPVATVAGDSAGFAALDIASGAAACTVGTDGGLRHPRMIGDTGILASGPRPAGEEYPGLPMLVVNVPRKDAFGAVTATGAAGSALRAVRSAAPVFNNDEKPEAALAAAPKLPGARTNLIYCPTGIGADPNLCRFVVEPGASGLGVGTGLL